MCRTKSREELVTAFMDVQTKLEEANDTLTAIQGGEIDAIVVNGPNGSKVYTLEGADQFYRLLVPEMNEGVATLTSKGNIYYANTQLAKLLKVPHEEITQHKLEEFITPQKLKKFQTNLNGGFVEKSTFETDILSADGTIIPVLVSIKSIKNFKGVYIVITDLSEHKHYEELMKIQKELKNTLRELERSNAELEQFAYVASHDLQEPLRMVSSFTQLLEKKYKDKLDDDADDYIYFIVDGAKRMHELINDLLTYSRINTHEKEFEKVDMEAVFKQALINLIIPLEENDAVVTHDKLPTVNADYFQMLQLLQNLIENALKYRGNETPKIHVAYQGNENEDILIVIDNGIGIAPQYHERIFNVFQRLHERTKYQGTGIGLSICKRILEKHGGKIWVDSNTGKGAKFYCCFPMVKDNVLS